MITRNMFGAILWPDEALSAREEIQVDTRRILARGGRLLGMQLEAGDWKKSTHMRCVGLLRVEISLIADTRAQLIFFSGSLVQWRSPDHADLTVGAASPIEVLTAAIVGGTRAGFVTSGSSDYDSNQTAYVELELPAFDATFLDLQESRNRFRNACGFV